MINGKKDAVELGGLADSFEVEVSTTSTFGLCFGHEICMRFGERMGFDSNSLLQKQVEQEDGRERESKESCSLKILKRKL